MFRPKPITDADIRRALADAGMELPADRTVPTKLVAVNGKCPIHGVSNDDNQHPGLDDGAGIVEQPTPLRWGCVLHQCKDGWWLVRNASGTHWWMSLDNEWLPETMGFRHGVYINKDKALKDFANCQTPPPDWTEPEQPERFDEFTGAPTTDPASRAIAAHTTPGKRHATDPTAEELDTIAEAALRGRDHLEIAVMQYGLRTYGAGMDFTLGLMAKGNR